LNVTLEVELPGRDREAIDAALFQIKSTGMSSRRSQYKTKK